MQQSYILLTWFIFYLQSGVTWFTTKIFIALVEANLEVQLHVEAIVILFNLILASLITSSVFVVLKTTAEACVLCFVDDLVRNVDSGKPFYSSKNLITGLTLREVKDSDTYIGLEKIKNKNAHLSYIKVACFVFNFIIINKEKLKCFDLLSNH